MKKMIATVIEWTRLQSAEMAQKSSCREPQQLERKVAFRATQI